MPETKNKKDLIVTVLITVVVIFLIGYNIFTYYGAQLALPGKEIKEITGRDPVTNKSVSVDVSSGTVIINFWATWCGACVQEMPELMKISKKYKVIGALRAPFRKDDFISMEISYPNVFPEDSFFTDNYISVLPTTILLKDGIVKKVQSGKISADIVDSWISKLNE